MTPQEIAADRLRNFTQDWGWPDRQVVEDVIAARVTAAPPRIDRRKAPRARPATSVRQRAYVKAS